MAKAIDKFKVGDALTAKRLNELVDGLNRLRDIRVSGGLIGRMGPGGIELGMSIPTFAKVAKVGGSAIPAMSGSTPGSGDITLYNMGATDLATGVSATAYNLAEGIEGEVAANAWVMLLEIDSKLFVVWEACAA